MYVVYTQSDIFFTEMPLGQGCKACSQNDLAAISTPHESVTQQHVRSQILSQELGPSVLLLQKTHSFWAAMIKAGCRAPPDPYHSESRVVLPAGKRLWKEKWDEQCHAAHRGHVPQVTCQGQLILDYDHEGKMFIQYVIFVSK